MGVTGFDGDDWRLWTTRDIGSHRNQDTGKTKCHETYGYGRRCGPIIRLARPSSDGTWEQKPSKSLRMVMEKKRRKTRCKRGHLRTPENIGPDDHCRICKAAHAKLKSSVVQHREWQVRLVESNQIWINKYLGEHPCVDCGNTDPVVLEFDHRVASQKNRDVMGMMLYSVKTILEEIAKCDVTCANCHTIRTARRANTLRWRLNQ